MKLCKHSYQSSERRERKSDEEKKQMGLDLSSHVSSFIEFICEEYLI